jgi:pimeloyl-ACP methyl ester carboxylesterase
LPVHRVPARRWRWSRAPPAYGERWRSASPATTRPGEEVERLWQQLQRELARLVPGGRLVIATQSGHDIQDEQPELVLDAIRDVVLAVRAGDLVPH